MPRAHSISQAEFPYNIGARTINKDWFSLPMPVVWQVMSEHLHFIHHAFEVEILAFVLMSNHFHLIVRTPRANLSEAMRWFMLESSRELLRYGNRINQTYGGPHFRCLIRGSNSYLHAYKYLYHNPVRAGLCDNVLDYHYSTLRGLLGLSHLLIPIREDSILFENVEDILIWLNKPPEEENWLTISKALRKKEFKISRLNHRPHFLEFDTL